jgi:SAM-dependent methyltransferase
VRNKNNLLRKLREIYCKEQYQPGTLGLIINPFYFARKELFNGISLISRQVSGKVLDIGCGQKPYAHLFSSSEYVGLEIDLPENRAKGIADVYYKGNNFPLHSKEFDWALCTQVLEHVFNPDEFLSEVSRILKDGGYLFLTVPFVWDEHEQPHDYARYSSFGIKYLLEKHGFEILEHKKTLADVRVLFQLINAFLFKSLAGRNAYIGLLVTVAFIAPINILGKIIYKLFPENKDFYLDNAVLAKKKKSA